MVLTGAGEVFSWGFNGNGQLGIGNLSNQSSPSLVVGLNNVFISQVRHLKNCIFYKNKYFIYSNLCINV